MIQIGVVVGMYHVNPVNGASGKVNTWHIAHNVTIVHSVNNRAHCARLHACAHRMRVIAMYTWHAMGTCMHASTIAHAPVVHALLGSCSHGGC